MIKELRCWTAGTLVVFACCVALGAYEAEAALVDPGNRAAMLLSECGYLPPVDSGSNVNISEEEMFKAFSKFQAHMGIDVTGSLDAETFRLMNLPGCGEAQIVGPIPVSRSRRDANPYRDWDYGHPQHPSYPEVPRFPSYPGMSTWWRD